MAGGDRATLRVATTTTGDARMKLIDVDVFEVEAIEIERPQWGMIIYRSAVDHDVILCEQVVSVGPYKVDVLHSTQLSERHRSAYTTGRLDLAELAGVADRHLTAAATSTAHAAETARVHPWTARQVAAAESLRGRVVEGWEGLEMAVRSNADETVFNFTDPQVPCLQLGSVGIATRDGHVTTVETSQNNTEFGLTVTPGAAAPRTAPGDGFRWRSLDELPLGEVTDVITRLSPNGDVTEVELRVGGAFLLLLAGETYETPSDQIEFRRFDESVLVFDSSEDVNSINWIPPR